MISILHPFAEHVRELQAKVSDMSEKISKTSVEVDQHQTKLHHHETQLCASFSKAKDMEEQARAARKELENTQSQLADLRSSHEVVQSSLHKAEDNIQTSASTVETMKRELQDTGAQVGRLSNISADFAKRFDENVEKRLDSMCNLCKELNDRQYDTQKDFQAAKISSDTLARSLDSLMNDYTQKREDDAARFAALGSQVDVHDAKLADAKASLKQHAESLSSRSAEIESLRESMSQLVHPEQLQTHLKDLRCALGDLNHRVQQSEDSIAEIIFDSASDKRSLENLVSKVQEKVDKSMSDIVHLEENERLHRVSMQAFDVRANKCEAGVVRLCERADNIEKEMERLTDWRKSTAETLIENACALDQTRSSLQQAKGDLIVSNSQISCLKRDVSAAHETLSCMSARLETCYKYFHGLGRGLQDTHRQVLAGEGGMLAPKSEFGTPLPVLPKTPRAVPPMSPHRRYQLSES
jgi:chromosome segregation ATPase